jgi:hypothetical protein
MSDDPMVAMQEMAAPGPEHERLKSFLGTFKATVSIFTGPGDPMVSTGTMTNTLELGGRFIKQDYKGDPLPGPTPMAGFEGQGFWGFNKNTQRYEGFWIDTASTVMQHETGTLDDAGRVWTMTGEVVGPDGAVTRRKSIITLVDDDHHSMESFFSQGDNEFKGMEIQYVRAQT